ncbi:hypothetical protein BKA81DRAFT_71653 [Phyllosticta paracitricarpa]
MPHGDLNMHLFALHGTSRRRFLRREAPVASTTPRQQRRRGTPLQIISRVSEPGHSISDPTPQMAISESRHTLRFRYVCGRAGTAAFQKAGDAVIRVFTVSPKIRMLALVPHTGTLDRSWTCHLGIPLRRAIPCRRRLNLGRVRSDLVVSDGEERPFRVSTRSGSRRAQENTRVRH